MFHPTKKQIEKVQHIENHIREANEFNVEERRREIFKEEFLRLVCNDLGKQARVLYEKQMKGKNGK